MEKMIAKVKWWATRDSEFGEVRAWGEEYVRCYDSNDAKGIVEIKLKQLFPNMAIKAQLAGWRTDNGRKVDFDLTR